MRRQNFFQIIGWMILSGTLIAICCSLLADCCRYKYAVKSDPAKIRLCVSSRYVPWRNETVRGMIHENTEVFCSKSSQVNKYFSLVNLTIPGVHKRIHVSLIERSCDMLISVTNGRFTHETYNQTKDFPLVLAIPTNNTEILVIWSDKMRWKQWMISNGFGKYVAKPVDLKRPLQYPFILKEGLSENSQGVTVVENATQLQAKLAHFKAKSITNYYGEEALTGMGKAQGIFYVSAFQGKVLSIQCYLQIAMKSTIQKQNFSNHIFLAGRPPDKDPVRGTVHRVTYDDETSNIIHHITHRGHYTGIYCAEFKMNQHRQIIFMEFNARICYFVTQKDEYFLEAYLPLAFAMHRSIRSMTANRRSHSDRISMIVSNSKQWYHNQTLVSLARNYHLHSPASKSLHAELPSMWEMLVKSNAILW